MVDQEVHHVHHVGADVVEGDGGVAAARGAVQLKNIKLRLSREEIVYLKVLCVGLIGRVLLS